MAELFEAPVDELMESFEAPEDDVAAFEDQPAFSFSDAASGIGEAFSGLQSTAPAAWHRLKEGLVRPDKYSPEARAAFDVEKAYNQKIQEDIVKRRMEGTSTYWGDLFRSSATNVAFSTASMTPAIAAAGAGAAVGSAVPVYGTIAGGIAGLTGAAGSGVTAYRMAGSTFLDEAFQELEADSKAKNGRGMNEEERAKAYEALLPVAQNTALWESGPEIVGNAISLGLGKVALGIGQNAIRRLVTTSLGRTGIRAAAGAGVLGGEFVTETATELGQAPDRAKLEAFREGKPMDQAKSPYDTPGGIRKAFEQIAGPTAAQVILMAGGAKTVHLATRPFVASDAAKQAAESARAAGLPMATQALEAQATALAAAAQNAPQKPPGQAAAVPAPAPLAPAASPAAPAVDAEAAIRAEAPLTYSDEQGDAVFVNGVWTLPDGTPAPNAPALEAARQAYVQSGDLPEGMQPMEAPANETTQDQIPEGSATPTIPTGGQVEGPVQEATEEEEVAPPTNPLLARPGVNATNAPAELAPTAVAPETPDQPPGEITTAPRIAPDEAAPGEVLDEPQKPSQQPAGPLDALTLESPSAPAKEKKARVGRKLTPEQTVMRTPAFRTDPTVASDIISKTQAEVTAALSPPLVVTVKDPQTGKKKLELGPGYKGMAEWDWYLPLLEDPETRAEVDRILFGGNEAEAVNTFDQMAQPHDMTGMEYGEAMLGAALERLRIAREMIKNKGATAEDQHMAGREAQRIAFEKATKKGKGKRAISTTVMEPGEVLVIDGQDVEVTAVDPETGDVTLRDGTRFGEQTLENGEQIWVEKTEPNADQTGDVGPMKFSAQMDFDDYLRATVLSIDAVVQKLDASAQTPGITVSKLAEEVTRLAGDRLKDLANALGFKAAATDIAQQLIAENTAGSAQKRADEDTPQEKRPVADVVSTDGVGERALTPEEKREKRQGSGLDEAPEGTRLIDWADDVIGEGNLSAGLNPRLLAAHGIRAAHFIREQGENFAAWSAEQIARFGDAIRQHLQRIWDYAKALIAKGPETASIPVNEDRRLRRPPEAGDGSVSRSPAVLARHFVTRIVPAIAEAHGIPWSLGPRGEDAHTSVNDAGRVELRIPSDLPAKWARLTPAGQEAARQQINQDLGILAALVDTWAANPKGGFLKFIEDFYTVLREGNANQQELKDLREEAIEQGAITPPDAKLVRRANSRPANIAALEKAAAAGHPFSPTLKKRLDALTESGTASKETLRALLEIATGKPIAEVDLNDRLITLTRHVKNEGAEGVREWVRFALSQILRLGDPSVWRNRELYDAIRRFREMARSGKLGPAWKSVVDKLDATDTSAGTAEAKNLADMQKREDMVDRSAARQEAPASEGPTTDNAENDLWESIKDTLHTLDDLQPRATLEAEDEGPITLRQWLAGERGETRAEKTQRELDEQQATTAPTPNPFRFSQEPETDRIISRGVAHGIIDKVLKRLERIFPNAANAWRGTRKELEKYLRGNEGKDVREGWITDQLTLYPSKTQAEAEADFEQMVTYGLNKVGAFTFRRRTYLISDQLAIRESDGSPENAVWDAVKHEDAHEGLQHLRDTNPEVEATWQGLRNAIPADELDALAAKGYPAFAGWRTSPYLHDRIADEWFAAEVAKAEKRGKPAEGSLVARFIAWLKDVLKRLSSDNAPVTTQALLRFMDAARVARFRDAAEASSQGIRFSANPDGDVAPARMVQVAIGDGAWEDAPLEKVRKPVYNKWSPDKQQEYTDYQNNKNVPASLKYFAQFLGSRTGNRRLTQKIGPMILFARNTLGGDYGQSPEVTPENIEKAWEIAKKMLSNKTFAAKYIERFQTEVSPMDEKTKLPLHQGQAAAAVLQLELMDFAVNVLAQTGDMRLYRLMEPMSNDTIIGDYATMSSAARLLNIRSVALRTKGLWTALKSIQKDLEAGAVDKHGEDAVTAVKDAVDPNENSDLKEEHHEQFDEALDTDLAPTVDAISKMEADYESDGMWKRIRETLADEEQALMIAFQASMMKLDRLLQQQALRKAQAGSQIKPSMAEDAGKWESDEDLEAAIVAEQGRFLELLHKLTAQDASEVAMKRRQKMLKNKLVKAAVEHLSANEQARKLLDRFANRPKRLTREKPVWRTIFDDQVRKPLDEEAFKTKIQAAGISEHTAFLLFKQAEVMAGERADQREATKADRARLADAKRKAKKEAEAADEAENAVSQYEEEAQQIIENATKEPKAGKAPSALRDLQRDFVNGKINEQQFRDGATALGVTPETLETLTDISASETERRAAAKQSREAAKEARAEEERINRAIDTYNEKITGERKEQTKGAAAPRLTDTRAFISEMARRMSDAPVSQQNDPVWVKETIIGALISRGLPADQAEKFAAAIEHKFSAILREGQAKAAMDAGKAMDMDEPTWKAVGAAIRTGFINPLHPNPAVQALAERLGYKALTTEDYQQLAKLDAFINSGYPTQAAWARTLTERILSKASTPKTGFQIIAQVFRNGALGSLGVQFLNWISPAFQIPTMLLTDILGYTIDSARGKGSRTENLKAISTTFTNLWEARKNWYNQAKFSLKNDSYQNRMQDYLVAERSIYDNLMKAWGEVKDSGNNPAKRTLAFVKMLWLSTDWVRRAMASADATWTNYFQNAILSNETVRILIQDAGMTAESAMEVIKAAGAIGALEEATQLANGTAPEMAALIGSDVTRDEIARALVRHTGVESKGREALTTSIKSPEVFLGNREPEKGGTYDIVSHVLEIIVKRGAGLVKTFLPTIGTPIVGFVSVAANIMDRSFYFTPYGWLRVWAKTKNKELYKETMATDGMMRQRAIEPLVSVVAFAILAALRYDPDDDDDWGIYLSGNGPENPTKKKAWEALHKAGSIEFIWNDKPVFSMPYIRGGFDHMAVPLTMMAAVNDVALDGKKAKGHGAEYAAALVQTAGSNLMKQAQFYGLRNLMSSTPSSDSPAAMARSAAYMVNPMVPWGGTIKSLAKIITGQQDESSTRSAILSQIPVLQPIFGSPEPKLNFLGDPIGHRTDDQFQKVINRLGFSGMPFWVNLPEQSRDIPIYEFLIKEGLAPSMPLRPDLESKNGFIADAKWSRYLKTRGRILKDSIRSSMSSIRAMSKEDAQDEIENISRDSTRRAKRELQLR